MVVDNRTNSERGQRVTPARPSRTAQRGPSQCRRQPPRARSHHSTRSTRLFQTPGTVSQARAGGAADRQAGARPAARQRAGKRLLSLARRAASTKQVKHIIILPSQHPDYQPLLKIRLDSRATACGRLIRSSRSSSSSRFCFACLGSLPTYEATIWGGRSNLERGRGCQHGRR